MAAVRLPVVWMTIAVAFYPTATSAQTCSELAEQANSANRTSDLAQIEAIVKRATHEGVCRGRALDDLGRGSALALLVHANRASPADRPALINRALALGRPWQATATAADLAAGDKRHADAARLYQEALDDIRNERLNPTPPAQATIASLVKKAEAASLLAGDYVARVDRNGAPAGLACTTFRGYTVTKTALPIEFEYKEPGFKLSGTASMTAKGRAAVADLLAFLTRQGSPAVQLIGHTDPIGGDAYNRDLSEKRAETVKAFLVAGGYKGVIRTVGRGRTEPFPADDPGSYTEAERHQLDRRVELDRQGGATCAAP